MKLCTNFPRGRFYEKHAKEISVKTSLFLPHVILQTGVLIKENQ